MAVVFISPKQRQNMFFLGITIMLALFLAVIFFGVFLSKPKQISQTLIFNRPKINIDMGVFDTPQFTSLKAFPEMQMQYSYTGTTKDKNQASGFISASSIDAARAILIASGLDVSSIKEAQVGRDNPFSSYYQVPVVTPAPKKAR